MGLNQLGIKAKLLILVGFALVAFSGLGYFANRSIASLRGQVELFADDRVPKADAIADLRAAANAIPRFMWLALVNPHASEPRRQALEKVDQYVALLKGAVAKYEKLTLSEKEKASLAAITESLPAIFQAVEKGKGLLLAADDAATKAYLLGAMAPPCLKVNRNALDLAKDNAELNAELAASARAQSEQAQRFVWIVSACFGLAIFLIGGFYSSYLAKRLLEITESVAGASDQVSAASHQLSTAADQLSSTSQQQASAIEETSASLTEISGMVQSNVKGAEEANETLRLVQDIGENTRKSMEGLNSAMSEILESNRRIEKLVKVIEEVGQKTEVIDEIVFKTQLLSFNASVEAERAGEHGRGFAVVAQEVGTLAQMSGKAATEISAIVKGSIKEAEEVARENKAKVEAGGEIAEETQGQMAEVLKRLSQVGETMNRIVAASREQSQGIGQISASVDSLNQATQETASTAEESASASTELSGQAESLGGLVGELRAIVGGEQGGGGKGRKGSEEQEAGARRASSRAPRASKVIPLPARAKAKPAVVAEEASPLPATGTDAWEKL